MPSFSATKACRRPQYFEIRTANAPILTSRVRARTGFVRSYSSNRRQWRAIARVAR